MLPCSFVAMVRPDNYSLEDILVRLEVRGLLDDYAMQDDTIRFGHRGAQLTLPHEKAWSYVLGLIQGCRRANEHGAATPLSSVESAALQRNEQ